MKKNNIIKEKSFQFAIRVVHLEKFLTQEKKAFVLGKQILRSGTSIGANVHEAVQGFSRKDFAYKMSIALKESHETEFWLKLLHATKLIDDSAFESILNDNIELNKILASIVKTSKLQEQQPNRIDDDL